MCGPGSSVGIATDYGLHDPGSNPGGDEIFRPSRPVRDLEGRIYTKMGREVDIYIYMCVCVCVCGPGSSVGIATDYGLHDPGSNPGGDEIFFRPSRPVL